MLKITALIIALYLALCFTLSNTVAPLYPSLDYEPIPARYSAGFVYRDGLHCEHLHDSSVQCDGFMPGGAWLVVQLSDNQLITQSSVLLINCQAEINAGQLIERWGDPVAQRDVGWAMFLVWPHKYAAAIKPLSPYSKIGFIASQLDSMPVQPWQGWKQ